jgi:hypothetical protein
LIATSGDVECADPRQAAAIRPLSLPIKPDTAMSKLSLSVAVRDYDRTRPLTDGSVQIDGVDPVFMALDPEEIFFRASAMPSSTSANCRCRARR